MISVSWTFRPAKHNGSGANKLLLDGYSDRKTSVLIVDEAHKLSTEVLEEIRLLSNFEKADGKLVQIVLAGQTELMAFSIVRICGSSSSASLYGSEPVILHPKKWNHMCDIAGPKPAAACRYLSTLQHWRPSRGARRGYRV